MCILLSTRRNLWWPPEPTSRTLPRSGTSVRPWDHPCWAFQITADHWSSRRSYRWSGLEAGMCTCRYDHGNRIPSCGCEMVPPASLFSRWANHPAWMVHDNRTSWQESCSDRTVWISDIMHLQYRRCLHANQLGDVYGLLTLRPHLLSTFGQFEVTFLGKPRRRAAHLNSGFLDYSVLLLRTHRKTLIQRDWLVIYGLFGSHVIRIEWSPYTFITRVPLVEWSID
jgi:hypothetical protein